MQRHDPYSTVLSCHTVNKPGAWNDIGWWVQRAFIEEEAAPSATPADPAQLAILRLTHDEMSFRAVAVAGNWASTSAAAIQEAPLVKQQQPFSIFETQGRQQWVMMPAWSAVMAAAEPVALVIDDCAQLDVLLKQTKVQPP